MILYNYEKPDNKVNIAKEFWEKSKEEAECRKKIEGLHGLDKYDAILKDIWTQPQMDLYGASFLFTMQNLDEWLTEDTYMREVDNMCNSISIF